MYIRLHGEAVDTPISLSTNFLEFKPTYSGLSNQLTVVLYNKSDIKVQYSWKKFASSDAESRASTAAEGELQASRSQKNQLKEMESSRALFSHNNFQITPIKGEIWPRGQAEFVITFNPTLEQLYTIIAYCDVIGREERIPLNIRVYISTKHKAN